MNALIIDDDEFAIHELQSKLESYPDVHLVATTQKPNKGLEYIRDYQPDIVFLDVEMPDMSGISFLEEMGDADSKIIMYTSHLDYMLQSFRKDAFDFLMKPIVPEELEAVINHCRTSFAENERKIKTAGIKTNTINDKLLLYINTSDFQLVHTKDIGIFIYNGERRIWEIVVAGRKNRIQLKRSITRKMIMELDKHFLQVNQSHIINANYLIEVIDNVCHFYPPFDTITDVHIGRLYRHDFIDKFCKL